MSSRSTISTLELFSLYPDEEAARIYFEERRWHGEPFCPFCGGYDRITARKGQRLGYYRCRDCAKEFTVRTGTIFERSHVPLHKWLYSMYLVVTARKGISSLQLAKQIGVTQKTAWFVLGRLREACGDDPGKLRGIIEIDEAYIGGLEKNKHAAKKQHLGRGTVGKQALLGMRERGGKSIAMPISGTDRGTLHNQIGRHVEFGSTIYTDDHQGYSGMAQYEHDSVCHTSGEYVRPGGVHINSAESMWAVLKRGIYGTWHHVSAKHLFRYANECTFRLNEGRCEVHTLERLSALAAKAFQHRITYRELAT